MALPPVTARGSRAGTTPLILRDGHQADVPVLDRPALLAAGVTPGPALLADPDSTLLIPRQWNARGTPIGGVILERAARE
jgi:N-methylhydantoinase A/oxoprolinase/acetone carboxylase beta subunit